MIRLPIWVACLGLGLHVGGLGGLGRLAEADWPQHLGPQRTGVVPQEPLAEDWTEPADRRKWAITVGAGFAGPVVQGERVIIAHRQDDQEHVDCLNAATGERVWRTSFEANYQDRFGFNNGPRATPTIAEGRVYVLGAAGHLRCLDLKRGTTEWQIDTHERFDVPEGFFGAAGSPLVHDARVLLNVGGRQAGIVALAADSGKLLWQATQDRASYSSGIVAQVADQTLAVFFTRAGLRAVNPTNGEVVYSYPWRARIEASVNAATPLVIDGRIFLSTSYNTGAVLLRPEGDEVVPVWSGDRSLSNHYATSIHHDGHLYGFDGRQEFGPELRCVRLADGEVRWSQKMPAGSLIAVGEKLLVLEETGWLVQVAATPEGYREIHRAQILEPTVRAFPAFSRGVLYARNEAGRLVAFDLRPQR